MADTQKRETCATICRDCGLVLMGPEPASRVLWTNDALDPHECETPGNFDGTCDTFGIADDR